MYLNSHIRKIFNRATVLASSACLAMAVAPVAVHAQESFIGEEAETTAGVINPNDQSTRSVSSEMTLDEYWTLDRMSRATPVDATLDLPFAADRATSNSKEVVVSLKCQNVNKKHQNLLNRSPHLKRPVKRTLESAIPVLRMEKYFSQGKSMANMKIASAPRLL